MCKKSNHMILSESENCQITYCTACQHFSFVYNNCCASFKLEKLVGLRKTIESLDDIDFQYDFLNRPTAVIRGRSEVMGICLCKKDIEPVLRALYEAETLFEAHKIINCQ
ncbi:MAG: DUF6686 family protein [Bacteroidota bacterium]